MNDHDKSEPAFPGGVNSVHTNIDTGEPTQSGMTLRDYFAAKALQGDWATGEASNGRIPRNRVNEGFESDAQFYYRMADAMLDARKEKK